MINLLTSLARFVLKCSRQLSWFGKAGATFLGRHPFGRLIAAQALVIACSMVELGAWACLVREAAWAEQYLSKLPMHPVTRSGLFILDDVLVAGAAVHLITKHSAGILGRSLRAMALFLAAVFHKSTDSK